MRRSVRDCDGTAALCGGRGRTRGRRTGTARGRAPAGAGPMTARRAGPVLAVKDEVGGWTKTRDRARWGCFLPDLTRLASGSSTANLPRAIWQGEGWDARGGGGGSSTSCGGAFPLAI